MSSLQNRRRKHSGVRNHHASVIHLLLATLFFAHCVTAGYGDDLCYYRGNTDQWTVKNYDGTTSNRIIMAEGVEIRTDDITHSTHAYVNYAYAWKQISLSESQYVSTIVLLTDYRHEVAREDS